jgi:hypothetical protein
MQAPHLLLQLCDLLLQAGRLGRACLQRTLPIGAVELADSGRRSVIELKRQLREREPRSRLQADSRNNRCKPRLRRLPIQPLRKMIGSPVGKYPMNLNSRSRHIARHDVAACEWKHIETASGTVQLPAFPSVFQPGGVGGAC